MAECCGKTGDLVDVYRSASVLDPADRLVVDARSGAESDLGQPPVTAELAESGADLPAVLLYPVGAIIGGHSSTLE
jgi:hypothetical protein